MEPDTARDVMDNCDAIRDVTFDDSIERLTSDVFWGDEFAELSINPMYACSMARLKYSMDSEPLPDHENFTQNIKEFMDIRFAEWKQNNVHRFK